MTQLEVSFCELCLRELMNPPPLSKLTHLIIFGIWCGDYKEANYTLFIQGAPWIGMWNHHFIHMKQKQED